MGEPLELLSAFVEERLEQWRLPGLAIAIVARDGLVTSAGFGLADVARNEPITDPLAVPDADAFPVAILGVTRRKTATSSGRDSSRPHNVAPHAVVSLLRRFASPSASNRKRTVRAAVAVPPKSDSWPRSA